MHSRRTETAEAECTDGFDCGFLVLGSLNKKSGQSIVLAQGPAGYILIFSVHFFHKGRDKEGPPETAIIDETRQETLQFYRVCKIMASRSSRSPMRKSPYQQTLPTSREFSFTAIEVASNPQGRLKSVLQQHLNDGLVSDKFKYCVVQPSWMDLNLMCYDKVFFETAVAFYGIDDARPANELRNAANARLEQFRRAVRFETGGAGRRIQCIRLLWKTLKQRQRETVGKELAALGKSYSQHLFVLIPLKLGRRRRAIERSGYLVRRSFERTSFEIPPIRNAFVIR